MNILTAGSVKLLGGTLVFLCAVALAVSVTAAPGLIDFRNYIPGVVDAPVFRADGTNRLSGTLYLAQLYAGPDEGSLTPWGAAAASFGVGEMAGYLEDYGDPAFLIIGTPFTPGQRISVQVVAFEVSQNLSNYDNMWPPRLWGRSPVFQIVISDSPTPLVGLQSFSLRAAPIDQIRVSGNQVILRWSAGDGTVNYAVETTSMLSGDPLWEPASGAPYLIAENNNGYWHCDWVLSNVIVAPFAYYRIRLLEP